MKNGSHVVRWLSLALVLCSCRTPYAQSANIVHTVGVDRYVGKENVAEVIRLENHVELVRKGKISQLGAAPFDMPAKFVLVAKRSEPDKFFYDALQGLKCGAKWVRREISKEDAIGPLGEWRIYHNNKCYRSEIVFQGKIVFESIALRSSSITYVTHMH